MPFKSLEKFSGKRIMLFGIGILIASFFLMRIETISFSLFVYLFFLSAIFMIWGLIKQGIERRRRYKKLFEEYKEIYDKNFTEARRVYPVRNDMPNKEFGEIVDKQTEYTKAKNELWFQQLKEKQNLTDYELSELKNQFILDFLRGK